MDEGRTTALGASRAGPRLQEAGGTLSRMSPRSALSSACMHGRRAAPPTPPGFWRFSPLDCAPLSAFTHLYVAVVLFSYYCAPDVCRRSHLLARLRSSSLLGVTAQSGALVRSNRSHIIFFILSASTYVRARLPM